MIKRSTQTKYLANDGTEFDYLAEAALYNYSQRVRCELTRLVITGELDYFDAEVIQARIKLDEELNDGASHE